MHHPQDSWRVPAAFVSIRTLRGRRSVFRCRRVIIDSGAFRELELHGNEKEYAAELLRWKIMLGRKLLAGVAQDYMCEPFMLARTGLTTADHQRLTIERYDRLLACDTGGTYIMPVLQGYAPGEYVEHVRQYGDRLAPRAYVGVGSVCKRNGDPQAAAAVFLAIKRERPDLRLHAFGIKITALRSGLIRDLIFSADSTAWSLNARKNGRNQNDPAEAVKYASRVSTMAYQRHFPGMR